MKIAFLFLIMFASIHFALAQVKESNRFEKRCGWYDNPTPSNSSLYDKDGEWLVSAQGGHHAKGGDQTIFSARTWVVTNSGGYGYGCACFRMLVDRETKYVLLIKSAYDDLSPLANKTLPYKS